MVKRKDRDEESSNGGDGSGAQVSTMVKGTPEEVAAAHEKLHPSKTTETGDPERKDKDEKFFELLDQTEGFRIIAQRRSPLKLNERELVNTVYIGETPLDMYDIENTIKEGYGGKIWALSIINPKTNHKVGGKTLEIFTHPQPVFDENESEDAPTEYEQVSQRELDEGNRSPTAILRKQLEEDLEFNRLQRLSDMTGGGKSNDGIEKLTSLFNQKFDSLKDGYESRLKSIEDQRREERHKEDLEKIKQGNELREIKQELASKQEAMMNRMETMMKEVAGKKSSDQDGYMTKFLEIMNQSTDSKISSMGEQQKSTMEMMKTLFGQLAQRNDSLEMVEKVLGVVGGAKDMLGMGAAEPQDIASRITDGVTKLAPQVLEYLEKRKAQGGEVTQDMMTGKFKEMGEKIAQNVTKDIPGMVKKELGQTTPKKVIDVGPSQVSTPPAQNPAASSDDVAKATKVRVNNTLQILLQEVSVRPRKAAWLEYAVENLPEDLLEKIAAIDVEDKLSQDKMFNLLKEHADPKLITSLVANLALSAKGQEWVKAGFKILISIAKGEGPEEESPETPSVTPPAQPEPTT